jgi:hypothetical protein
LCHPSRCLDLDPIHWFMAATKLPSFFEMTTALSPALPPIDVYKSDQLRCMQKVDNRT